MSYYRKKPVVIEAHQWWQNGDHPLDYAGEVQGFENGEFRTWTGDEAKALGWEGQLVRYFRTPEAPGDRPCGHCGRTYHDHGWVETLEGGHMACPGDWIITGTKGEHYTCKPDIFEEIYEAAAPPIKGGE